jgi:hypothetical protein
MTDTGVVQGIRVTATDAKAGATSVEGSTPAAATDTAIRMAVTSGAMRVTTDVAVTDAVTLEATASMAEAPFAVAEADSTAAALGAASMAEVDPTVADTGKATIEP